MHLVPIELTSVSRRRFMRGCAAGAVALASLINPYHNVKCPGVADIFRIPKPGAAFYLA